MQPLRVFRQCSGQTGFNPHPARRPDATVVVDGGVMLYPVVSILIRPEGRMQPGLSCDTQTNELFQSSSGQKAGCNLRVGRFRHQGHGFNPHPARRPDATAHPVEDNRPLEVSILIRPEGRMQRRWPPPLHTNSEVSILIRPEGRMQRVAVAACRGSVSWVSILIRPEGRMQRPVRAWPVWRSRQRFNPHPARRPDATSSRSGRHTPTGSFNPHPARRPDATYAFESPNLLPNPFQSSSGQKAGCNPARAVLGLG